MLNIARTLTACCLLFIVLSAAAEVLQYHPNSPAYIGGNFDPSYPGRAYPPCLRKTTVRGESLLPGQKPGVASATEFFIKKVTSRTELYHIMNVSLSLSGSYGLFSADFSGSMEQENTFSEDSFTFVVYGFSNFGKFILETTELNEEAKALRNNPVGFRTRCGSEYVGIEVRAVQASAIFKIKNLSKSDKQVLEASFNASYGGGGPLDIGANASFKDFIKTAAQYGQIEIHVHAIGGPGFSALAPIMTQVDKPDEVLKTLQKYFEGLDLSTSAAIAYNTGSLQSLISRPAIEDDLFFKYIGDLFIMYENLGAQQRRLSLILAGSRDWGLTEAKATAIGNEIKSIDETRQKLFAKAMDCKRAFNDMSAGMTRRRAQCSSGGLAKYEYDPKFVDLEPMPYYLRYFTSNELIPNEEVLNFSIRGSALKSVQVVKSLDIKSGIFKPVNSIQIHDEGNGERSAGTSVVMKEIPDSDLPIGIQIEMDSGNKYLEQFAFTRAPAVPAANAALFLKSFRVPFGAGKTTLFSDRELELKSFQAAKEKGYALPPEWTERDSSGERQ